MDTSIALALASLSFAFSSVFTLVGGGTFIYIAIKVIRTSDEFARKADTTVVETKADTAVVRDLIGNVTKNLEYNMDFVLPMIEDIERQLKQLKNQSKAIKSTK